MTTPNDQSQTGAPVREETTGTPYFSRPAPAAAEAPPTQKPASPPTPAADEGRPEPSDAERAYYLEVPKDIPVARVTDEWVGVLGGFAGAARDAGVPHGMAQQFVESFVDADISIGGYNGDFSADDAEKTLRGIWRDQYDSKLAAVHQTVKSLGDGFAQWLDDSEMGNHPAVLIVLSQYGDMKLTKAEAQIELQKIMGDPKGDYFSQDNGRRKSTVVRVKALSRIAYAEDKPADMHPVARAKNAEAARVEQTATKAWADARSEAAALIAKLDKGNPAERAAASKRFMELTSKLL